MTNQLRPDTVYLRLDPRLTYFIENSFGGIKKYRLMETTQSVNTEFGEDVITVVFRPFDNGVIDGEYAARLRIEGKQQRIVETFQRLENITIENTSSVEGDVREPDR